MAKRIWWARAAAPLWVALGLSSLAGAQTIVPLNTLVANGGSVSAGGVTFSEFSKPGYIATPFAVEAAAIGEFGDIGVSAVANPGGSVSLVFTAIDATGAPAPITGEAFRSIRYRTTSDNPGLRLHSVDQHFGPQTAVSGAMAIVNQLNAAELVPNIYESLLLEQFDAGGSPARSSFMPSADGSGTFTGSGGILLPGGNLPTYTMASEFYLVNGRFGSPASGTLDSITLTFTLVPTGTAVPPVVVNLAQTGDVHPFGGQFAVDGFQVNATTGIGSILLTNFAQDGGAAVTLASSNPSALPVPATITIPQGYWMAAPFLVGPANVDQPTAVTVTAAFNGRTQTQSITANPASPLTVTDVGAAQILGAVPANTFRVSVLLSRTNVSPATVQLFTNNPTVLPVPASITIPALSVPGDFQTSSATVTGSPVGVDTPVVLTATFNGTTVSRTVTVAKTIDMVTINKAELVVKNLQLKVEAFSNTRGAVLTLYNAATGQLIGTMVDNGASGVGEKYSFQGTVSPVTSLLLKSSLNGTATGAVAQK